MPQNDQSRLPSWPGCLGAASALLFLTGAFLQMGCNRSSSDPTVSGSTVAANSGKNPAVESGSGPVGKISEGVSFLTEEPMSRLFWSRQVIGWATDKILISAVRDRMIQAFDPVSGKELWRKEFAQEVCAVTCSSSHVYVALDTSVREDKAGLLRRLDVDSGADSTPVGVPQPSWTIRALLWCGNSEVLGVLQEKGIWFYSADLLRMTSRVPVKVGFRPVATSDGTCLLLADQYEGSTIFDPASGTSKDIYATGYASNRISPGDKAFLSNAFYSSDGRFIRIIDNSWGTGGVGFSQTLKGTVKWEDSKNGHAVAAIHWPSSRLAVSGTEQNLLLFSTAGDLIGEVVKATSDRTWCLAFSPSGTEIAAFTSDGRIKIFHVP